MFSYLKYLRTQRLKNSRGCMYGRNSHFVEDDICIPVEAAKLLISSLANQTSLVPLSIINIFNNKNDKAKLSESNQLRTFH